MAMKRVPGIRLMIALKKGNPSIGEMDNKNIIEYFSGSSP
jgi:hypothetical protein